MPTESHASLPPTADGSGLSTAAGTLPDGWPTTESRSGLRRVEDVAAMGIVGTAKQVVNIAAVALIAGIAVVLIGVMTGLTVWAIRSSSAQMAEALKNVSDQAREYRKDAANDRREYMADGRANRESLNAAV